MKTKLATVLILACTALGQGCAKSSAGSSLAEDTESSDWMHQTVYSTSGVAIEMDYKIEHSYDGDSFSYALWPLWFNVTASAPLSASDQIRVVLTPWDAQTPKDGTTEIPGYPGIAAATIDLSYAGNGRFTGQLANPFMTSEGNESGGFGVTEKLSVVVDGAWQNDSIDGKRDFLPPLNYN